MHAGQRSMCGLIVVDAESFRLLDTDVMPIFMIIALDIIITLRFSINCSAVICSPTVIISILREASSETYGPGVYFPSYKFSIYNFSFLFTYFVIFYFSIYKPKIPKTLLYHLSILDVLYALLCHFISFFGTNLLT